MHRFLKIYRHMVKKLFITLGLVLSYTMHAFSGVSIGEVSTCNLSTYMNKSSYNFSNYIEFETGGDSVNLNGYLIIHYGKQAIKGKMEERWRWRITNDQLVGSNSVIWMDEHQGMDHSPYKLDADGGSIVLYDGSTKVDSFAYEAMDANIAYGIKDGVIGYMTPSPQKPNTEVYADCHESRCKAPQFSHVGGVLEEPIELEILPQESAESSLTYYTLDGSIPSAENGMRYDQPIYIGGNANVRSITYQNGKMASKVSTVSFLFVDEVHSQYGGFGVPIISISVDSAYFYSDTIGICVIGTNGSRGEKDCVRAKANYNQDWKRPVHFEYIVDGKVVVSQEAEAAVEGGCSRAEKIKSLSIKASKKTGIDTFDYHFFASKPNVIHRALHIRNGGTAYSKVRFRDGLMQTFATGMNIDYQAYQPVAYYINGKYQGLMNLNERTNADYLDANFDVDDEDIDLITVSDQLGIRASKGDKITYDKLTSLLSTRVTDTLKYYEGACSFMDMDEYVDYQIFQQFIVNTDWPGNNTKIWREKKNGRFRWMLFDTDFGLGLPGYEYLGNYTKNMIIWCSGEGNKQWANKSAWMTEIFKGLKRNKYFQRKFTTKFLMHLSTTFTPENINAVFDSVTAIVNPEYQACFNKSAVDAAAGMRKFALNRPRYIYKHLMEYVGGTDTTSLEIQSANPEAELFMNGEKTNHYKGTYFKGYELELIAKAPEGYEFSEWKFSSDTLFEMLSDTMDSRYGLPGILVGKMKAAGSITATFKPAADTVVVLDTLPTLVINEVCPHINGLSKYSDASGEYTPWIEIYNCGEKNIDLAGYTIFITRADSVVKSETIPVGYGHMTLGAKEHKVFWTKGDDRISPDHLSFKLGKDTLSTICISHPNGEILDCVELVSTNMNESYGRETDGVEEWVIFTTDPLEHNPSPGKKNGVKDTTGVKNNAAESITLQLYPNPTHDEVNITASEKMDHIVVYDMTGRIIFREDPDKEEFMLHTVQWGKGIYLVEVITRQQIKTMKLIKVDL